MADTTFIDYSTVVPAAWLNDVNDLTYSGQFPLTTQSWGLGAVPLTYASQGVNGYIYNAANTGAVDSNGLLRIQSVNRNANIQLISVATGTASYSWLNQAGTFVGDMQYAYSVGDILWRTTPAGVPTEVMRLTSAGFLGINVVPLTRFHIKSTSSEGFRHESTIARGSGGNYMSFYDPTGRKGYIGYGGSVDDFYVYNELSGLISFGTVGVERLRIGITGAVAVTSATGTLGYGTGSGGTVTQATSKSTTVILNKGTGQITMNAASLAAGTSISFILSNNLVEQTDLVICHRGNNSGGDRTYRVEVDRVATSSVVITVTNLTGGALAEAVVINFALIKGVTS